MFTENTIEALKFNENRQKYLEEYLLKLKNKNMDPRISEARNNIKQFADFICSSCGKLYVKDQAIISQGMCDNAGCSGKIIANASINEEEEVSKKDDIYECTKCGSDITFKQLNKQKFTCECSGKNFLKLSTINKVMENTWDINQSLDLPLVDVWNEKGKIYAYYQYEDNDGKLNFVVCATGKFKEKDFIHFDINNGSPRAIVASLNEDPLIKFSSNDKCICSWAFTEDDEETQVTQYSDCRNKILSEGSHVEWVEPKGPVFGEVLTFCNDGVKIGLTKHPDYGYGKDKIIGDIVLSQEQIFKKNIKSY